MDDYDYCPTCGRIVQGGRVCRYCAQTADPPHREPAAKAAKAAPSIEPRHETETAYRSPAYGNRELRPIRAWMLIALGIVVVGALIALVVIWDVL